MPLSLPSLQNHSEQHIHDKSMDISNLTGLSYGAIWTSYITIKRRGYIGFTTGHSLQAKIILTQIAGYTPHFKGQVRRTILFFYKWASKSRKWRVLPVKIRIELISVDNLIQLWNELQSRMRGGNREIRRLELLPRRTWRSTWGHVRDPNHRVHHGNRPTGGW